MDSSILTSPAKRKKSDDYQSSNNSNNIMSPRAYPFPPTPKSFDFNLMDTPSNFLSPGYTMSNTVVPSSSDWSPSMKKPHSMPDNFSFNDPETPLVNGRRENRRERLDDSEITQALQLSDGIADSGDTLSRNKEAISKRINSMRIPPTKKDAKTKRPSINGKNSKPQEPDSVLHTNSDNSNGYISPVDQNDNYFSQKSDKHSSDEDSSGLAAITAAAESVEDASDVDYFLPNSQTSIESFPISRSNSLKPYTGNNQSDNHNDSIFGHSSISSNYNYNYIPDSNGHSDYVQRESPAVKAAAEAIRASSERYDSIQKSGSDEVSEMELFLSVADVLQNLSPAKPNMKRILESGDYNSMYSTYYGNYTADNSGAQQSEHNSTIVCSSGRESPSKNSNGSAMKADENRNISCNCKKSRCLKMYCDCFRLSYFCNRKTCNCVDCYNSPERGAERQIAIASIIERNPDAFKTKVAVDPVSNAKGHSSGCHCRKSACLKKYCECFTLQVPCADRCRCVECKNTPDMYRPEYHFNVHSAFAAASREAGLLGKFAIVGANDKPPSIGADMQLECVSLKNNGNNNNSDGTSSLRSSGEGSVSSRLGIAMKEENELSQSSSKSRDQRLTKQLSEKYDSTLGDNQNTYYNTLDSPNATRLSSGGFATGGNHYRDVQTISSTEVSISGSAVSSRHSFASPSSASKSNESDVHAGSPIASLMDLASMCEQRGAEERTNSVIKKEKK